MVIHGWNPADSAIKVGGKKARQTQAGQECVGKAGSGRELLSDGFCHPSKHLWLVRLPEACWD